MTPEERRERELRLAGRAGREDEELATAELDSARRSLVDACLDVGVAGAEVVVDTVTQSRRGRIVHVGEDLLTLGLPSGSRVEVALAHVVGVGSERRPGHARSVATGHPVTMVARCRELVQTEEVIELERRDGVILMGAATAASADHVELVANTTRWVVPISAIVSIAAL